MGWLDRLLHLPGEAALNVRQGGKNVSDHAGQKITNNDSEFRQWWRAQWAMRKQIFAERERLVKQRNFYTDTEKQSIPLITTFFGRRGKDVRMPFGGSYKNNPGMDPGMRAAQIKQLNNQMPGFFTTWFTRHPYGHTIAEVGKVFGKAVVGGGKLAVGAARAGSRAAGAAMGGAEKIQAVVTAGSNTILIVMAFMYHLMLFFTPSMSLQARFGLNMLMILFTIFFIFGPDEKNGDTYRFFFMWILVLEILIPYITATVDIVRRVDWIRLYIANGLLIWTWLWYALFVRGKNLGGFTKYCQIAMVLFYFGAAFASVGTMMIDWSDIELDTASTEQEQAFYMIVGKAKEGWSELFASVGETYDGIQDTITLRVKQASGEQYYYGVVEENEGEKLGVYLEDLKASQSLYEEYEEINVFATLRAYTLDDTVDVNLACTSGKEDALVQGEVYPDDTFEVYNLQEEELDCSFERLPVGTNKVTFNVNFNFETIGYLKRYFADRDAVVAATREGLDLLDEYQILDQNPVAHYTNGPIKVGMGPEQALIGVSETYTVKPRLAVTIDSGWDGTIKQLQELVLVIPEEMSLAIEECSDDTWSTYTVEACTAAEEKWESALYQECDGDMDCVEDGCVEQLEGYNSYVLDMSSNTRYADIEDYITISCRLNVDDVAGLLGATPIATHYFYVKTRYDYQLREDTSVKVEEETPLVGEDKVQASDVPTFTYNEREKQLQYLFYHYGDQLYTAEDEYGTPACFQAGIISLISGADPHYYDNGRYGLFGVTDAIGRFADVGTSYLYDVDKNFKSANLFLQKVNAQGDGTYGDDVKKVYYSMLYIQNEDDTDSNTNLAVDVLYAKYGVGSDDTSTDYSRFVSFMKTYVATCEELGLNEEVDTEASSDISTVQSAYKSGEISGISTVDDVSTLIAYLGLTGAPSATITIDEDLTSIEGLIIGFDAVLNYAGEEVYDLEVYGTSTESEWESFDSAFYDSHLLVQGRYDDGTDVLLWRTVDDFVFNVELIEEQEVELVEGFLYVEYTGNEIVFKVANDPEDVKDRTEVCDLRWVDYYSYLSCGDAGWTDTDDLPGLIVRNLDTEEALLGAGIAKVQIDWSQKRQFEAVMS
jgi:hypothetical protein